MRRQDYLGELEQMVLWAILRAGEGAYGPRILEELEQRAQRTVSSGALFATLDRLEEKSMIASRLADPEPGRGGRRKRFVTVTPQGRQALKRSRAQWTGLWDGLEGHLEGR